MLPATPCHGSGVQPSTRAATGATMDGGQCTMRLTEDAAPSSQRLTDVAPPMRSFPPWRVTLKPAC